MNIGNVAQLQKTINEILKQSSYEAFKSTFSNDLASNDPEKLMELISNKFADTLSKNASTLIANAINTYIESIKVDFKLTSPNGSVTGLIKLT